MNKLFSLIVSLGKAREIICKLQFFVKVGLCSSNQNYVGRLLEMQMIRMGGDIAMRRGRKSMTDMSGVSSKSETSQRSTTRCFANSSNRLDEYINCLVVTQRWLADEITRSLTFHRRALLYCAFPMQTQHGS